MNKIYEFAAEAAFTDYMGINLNDSASAKKLREAEHTFESFYNSLDLSEDVKSALDEHVNSLISKYENYAYISGFCKAAELAGKEE